MNNNVDFIKRYFIQNGITVTRKQDFIYFNCGVHCDGCSVRWYCKIFYNNCKPFLHRTEYNKLRETEPELFI